MRIILLLCLCGSIVGSNDTLNEIPIDRNENSVEEPVKGPQTGNLTIEKMFEEAVQAYLEEDWSGCVEGFNRALHGYKLYKRMVINCRQKCRAQADGTAPFFPENIEDMHFYEKKVKETLCLLTCNQDYRQITGPGALMRPYRETEQKIDDHKFYDYLHLCYYQMHRYQDAANALLTYLVKHPDHQPSISTLKHYLTLPGVVEADVINLEAAPYMHMYFRGVAAYENEDYKEAVGLFESSLRSYLQSEDECRFYCEGPFDQGWLPEFTSSVANHFAYCLKCKRICSHTLNSVNGDYHGDMLRSHYNYLQFSYYKLGNLKAACQAVESYLLFAPVDKTMLQNKEYYSKQPKVKEEYFIPREEILFYLKRQENEIKLLRYIAHEFTAIDARFEKYAKSKNKKNKSKKKVTKTEELGKLHPPPGHSALSKSRFSSSLLGIRDEKVKKTNHTASQPLVKAETYLVAKEKELDGNNRYVADGFLNLTECRLLIELASSAAVEGDGYEGNISPHSNYERFEGITIGKMALMVYLGQLKPEKLELLLKGTEAVRGHVERYFKLDRKLYFSYTHLVCRTALPDSPLDRDDLSHEIHADNCLLTDKDCLRESPAYVWRDYSAILYLNDDFEGGEFFFAKDRKNEETRTLVSPQCGRMIAFSAGGENLHGVKGVIKGKRCAVALWFTLDEKYTEDERVLAEAILKRVRLIGAIDGKNLQIPLRYEDVLIQNFWKDKLLQLMLKSDL